MTQEEAINELAGMYRITVVDSLDATVEANKKNEAIDMAISALQAQEPRVMTLGELRECVTYWIEDETGHVVPETIMDITGKDIMTIPVVHLTNGYAPIITKTTDGYNSKRFTGWRCWTSRPTDAQREAVKWDG